MSYDFDSASNSLPVSGGSAITADGTYAAVVNSSSYDGRSISAFASIPSAKAYSAVSWKWQESSDNSNWTDVDAGQVMTPLPSSLSGTSKVFHSGCISKLQYVKVGVTVSGGSTYDLVYVLGHLDSRPAFQDAITGVEG